ncbi:phosphatidylglycerophosphatase A [Accumulibacter sp.]|uniref:phosphatidylglycerophosphatase A family protein n=1 Tax=Accumulibacter sp. TaxID=2053492 RepID=UPI0025C0BE51|nr:phosphatidylglycerophosphatase A [Accumulibacter sp.]
MPSPPSIHFLLSHPAHLIACGFGSGLSPRAPGTVGTLFAWASFPLLGRWMNEAEVLGFLLLAFIGGALAVHKTGLDLGVIDHGSIVWDEIVPFWLVLLFCPSHWLWQTAAFSLFRFFDIVKPQPAHYFDEQVKNGLGVMCDDLVAAGYTLLVLAVLRFILP